MTRKDINTALQSALYKYAAPLAPAAPATPLAKPAAPTSSSPGLMASLPKSTVGAKPPITSSTAQVSWGEAPKPLAAGIPAAPKPSTPVLNATPGQTMSLNQPSPAPVGQNNSTALGLASPGANPPTFGATMQPPALATTNVNNLPPTSVPPVPASPPPSADSATPTPTTMSAAPTTLTSGSQPTAAQQAQPQPSAAPQTPEQKQQAETSLIETMQTGAAADATPEQKQNATVAAQKHVQQLLDSDPQMKQGLSDINAGNKDTPAAKAFQAKVDAAGNDFIKQEYAKLVQQNPGASAQEQGGFLNQVMQSYQNMPEPMKWMMGIGIGGGLLGILGSMFGGGGGMGLLGLLGLGAAGLTGAAGGMFGQGAQDMMGSALGSIGQATGMIPKDVNLDALKGENAVQKLTQESSGGGWGDTISTWWDPKAKAEQVKGRLAQGDQLQRLMSVPEGMRAGLLKQISPNSSPAEIQQILANAKSVHAAMNDPKSQLAQNMTKGREFVDDPEKYIRNNSWLGSAVGSSVIDPDQRGWATDALYYSNPISGTIAGVADIGRNLYEGDWWGVGRGALNMGSSYLPGGSLLKGLGGLGLRRWGLQGLAGMTKESHDQRALTLVRRWAKEADDKDIKDWMRKFRARGRAGRWVNTQRSAKKEKRVMCHNN